MNSQEREVMNILSEECAEVIQAISKIRRFGLDNSHKSGKTQRENLTQEIGDFLLLVDLLYSYGVFTEAQIHQAKIQKSIKLQEFSSIYK